LAALVEVVRTMDDARVGRQRVPGTKLAIPTPPSRLVPRPRLLAMLDNARDTMVTLLSAPAGAGKTLLLAEWVRERGPDDTAWVSLDSDDNDDNRFWSALLDAVSASTSVPPDSPLRHLAVPANPSLDHGFLADVVNALDDLAEPVVLILDDVHELTHPQPLHGLEALLQHQPAGLRLVLSARRDPHLPLARLRLADELTEIRAEDLKFTAAEIRALLAIVDIELDEGQLVLLLEQTEGWAAGLRLATLSMSETTDPDRFLAEFAANDRAVAAYLIDEVLSRLPEEMSEFLGTISVGDQPPAELAAKLSGRADAGALLDTIAERTSLVFRVDAAPHGYHVHALLRSHLLADLVRQDPERAARLNGIAADWYAAHDQPARAVSHAGQAGDVARITDLLHRHAAELILGGNHSVVREVLEVLGARRVAEDSLLALASALLHLEQGDPAGADRDLVHADTAWPAEPNEDLVSLRQFVRSRHAHVSGDVDELVRVTGDLTGGPGVPDAAAMLERGNALLAAGDRVAAGEQLRASLAAARDGHHDYVGLQGLIALAGLAGMEGDYGLMTTLAVAADEENGRRGWQRTVEGATAALLLAYGALLRTDSAECRRQALRASQVVDAADPPAIRWMHLAAETLCGAAEFELGDRAGGAQRIGAAIGSAGDSADFSSHQVAFTAMVGHRDAVLLGWGTTAAVALRWAQASIPESAEVHLMRARAQLALGRREAAGKIIQPVLDGRVLPVLAWTTIETWLLSAELTLAAGDDSSARRALNHALTEAARLDVPQPLVYAAPEVVDLLTSRLGKLGGTAERFAGRVFALRRALDVPPMVPLTARERAVLRLLPTLRSFDEIAEDLTVSANTVKTHVRAIYVKLGVSKRRDAVAVALERGLLDNEHTANAR
jgi:LuxR family transcriptional regulator, maltose regulon positive regulatory protein